MAKMKMRRQAPWKSERTKAQWREGSSYHALLSHVIYLSFYIFELISVPVMVPNVEKS